MTLARTSFNATTIGADNGVILSDFGVSRFFSQKLRREINAVNTMVSEVTSTGHLVMGTRGYMAPEVERGEEATRKVERGQSFAIHLPHHNMMIHAVSAAPPPSTVKSA